MKGASIVFEGLDAAVEGFAQGIGDAVFDVCQQANEVALEGLCHGNHRFDFDSGSTLEPLIKEALSRMKR